MQSEHLQDFLNKNELVMVSTLDASCSALLLVALMTNIGLIKTLRGGS